MCALRCHVDIEPFYLTFIIIHITYGLAIAYCACKLAFIGNVESKIEIVNDK